MNVNSLYPFARKSVNKTQQPLKVNTHEIATRPVDPAEQSPDEGLSQYESYASQLAQSLAEQNTLLYELSHQKVVLKSAHPILGTMLDQKT